MDDFAKTSFAFFLATGEGLEKLKRLIDPQLRDQMGSQARQVFKEAFHIERSVKAYEWIFQGSPDTVRDVS